MTKRRTLYLSTKGKNEEIIVVGCELCIRLSSVAPVSTQTFSITWSDKDLQISFKEGYKPVPSGEKIHYSYTIALIIQASEVSSSISDKKITFEFFDKIGGSLNRFDLELTSYYLSLDVDADRDGKVEQNSPHKNSWKWGPNGHGAILLVNCDQEDAIQDTEDYQINGPLDLHDMSSMIFRSSGPPKLPDSYALRFYANRDTAKHIGVFDLSKPLEGNRHLIGPKSMSAPISYPGRNNETKYCIEGLRFPEKGFNGLVNIHLVLLKNDVPVFEDAVQFRVAPWIMTPNTLEAQEIFVCRMTDNEKFLEELRNIVEKKAGKKLHICETVMNRGDRWMQDEIELGYTAAPHKSMPVVVDSPRDRGLQSFALFKLLGPDFGYVTRFGTEEANSLDSFGNLEVSPPVTVGGQNYPMGRILIGSDLPMSKEGRRMMETTSAFLKAQLVQPMVELFSDWLSVGHIDEFMSFVPSKVGREFRLLLASPNVCIEILKKLQDDGFGDAKLFEGNLRNGPTGDFDATTTVSALLNNSALINGSLKCQEYIDWNRDTLKRQLGLRGKDIIEIPCLFEYDEFGSVAFFPDMVNMLVLGPHLAIPKPFGPIIDGKCAFESYVRTVLEPLGLQCHFIDDWAPYHLMYGEVHCGTNTLRKPFDNFNWWDMEL